MKQFLDLQIKDKELSPAPILITFKPSASDKGPALPGKSVGEVYFESTHDQKSLVVSLGEKDKWREDTFRQAGGAAAKWMIQNKTFLADIDGEDFFKFEFPNAASALLEGLLLGAFIFSIYKSDEKETTTPVLQIRTNEPDNFKNILIHAQILTESVNLSRFWGHEPANIINPITLAERVALLAQETGLRCTILDNSKLEEIGAGGLVNVGKGSSTPSRLIILEYPGHPTSEDSRPIILVGKAITFDTGGYSLKGVENIVNMKYDKCGGVTVAATLAASARLGLSQPLVGIIAASENMISDHAYRPDDIIRMLSGKTVEIISTDAEGRLVLADALAYAQNSYSPKAIIDLATLTGGVLVALGRVRAAVMANNDQLAKDLISAGESTHERLWQLPMDEEFGALIKSDEADIKNSGGREGHAIIGGMFLKHFVKDDIPWAHLDIAGMADTNKDLPYCPKGATGFGVRLLIHYLENL